MNALAELTPSMLDRIRHDLVGLKMPRALEALDQIVRRLEHAEISALEAIDILLSEELTLRENSRIKTALRMGRLATIKTLSGFDFSFQPSLDRDRILGSRHRTRTDSRQGSSAWQTERNFHPHRDGLHVPIEVWAIWDCRRSNWIKGLARISHRG
jgi:DNA replication protein DnaC